MHQRMTTVTTAEVAVYVSAVFCAAEVADNVNVSALIAAVVKELS
jgi:hypothetical protein